MVNGKAKAEIDKLRAERDALDKRNQELHAQVDRLRAELAKAPVQAQAPARKRLPDDRESVTHHFSIFDEDGEHDGYITVGLYPDGTPGEVFLRMSKGGERGPYDSLAIVISRSLQHGVPLEDICQKLTGQSYSPSGMTLNPAIRNAKSPVDYLARWLARKYLPSTAPTMTGLLFPTITSREG